ncbi:MAG: DODA-type extradiol aromatic ring-opening family dioxygenase [Polyangiales bacterium]
MPAIFVAHGAPPLLEDALWMDQLATWANALAKPSAILMISAHWLDAPVTLGATRPVPLVYDFYGFPQKYYEMKYPSPGAPALATRVRTLIGNTASNETRGLDHGAFVPLMPMYPAADVPVLQMSIPSMDPTSLFELGKKLAPLRDERVLIVGSGFITHNLRALGPAGSPPPSWAADFDAWVADVIARRDVDALMGYRSRAPGVAMSLPTHEHFVPLIVAAGAAIDAPMTFPITGWAFGSATKRSAQFG